MKYMLLQRRSINDRRNDRRRVDALVNIADSSVDTETWRDTIIHKSADAFVLQLQN